MSSVNGYCSRQDVLDLTKTLIGFRSITPNDDGCLDFISSFLERLGFKCQILAFEGTKNLYARIGDGSNFCYLGHVDVVPTGDLSLWETLPFEMHVKDNRVFGRGMCDMKGSIVAFLLALPRFLEQYPSYKNALSILLTSNEEGDRKGGTQMALDALIKQGEKIDLCLIGEPTSRERVGDCIKIGRRGSVNFIIHALGKQGHVAYPGFFDNPITRLCEVLVKLKSSIDARATESFPDRNNLEVVSLLSDNHTFNIVPSQVGAMINIRFNDLYSIDSLKDLLQSLCLEYLGDGKFIIEQSSSSECCLASNNRMAQVTSDAVKEVSGYTPDLSTEGGVSDACYLAQHCNDWIELGLLNKTAHQVNENVALDDIMCLSLYYFNIIKRLML